MATFLHTMVRITDPDRSRRFYEALGFRFARDMDIVRDGQLEATNYFFSLGDDENVLELTFNHDGRTYELGTGYGHIAIGVTTSTALWPRSASSARKAWIVTPHSAVSVRSSGSYSTIRSRPVRWIARS